MFGLFDENREIISVLLALTQNNESFARKKTKPKTNWFSFSKLKLNQKRTSLVF